MDGASNPRAVWVNIDELTEPRPQDPRFFADLSDRIIDIGLAAGLRSSDAGRIKHLLNDIGNRHANYITEGRVREFVQGGGRVGRAERGTCRYPGETDMNQNEAHQLWAMLGAEGKAPTELTQASHVLPSYSVGIEPWIDRLARRYFQDLCRHAAHFKLVLAPYGGGKTHFLLTLGIRARDQEKLRGCLRPVR